MAKRITSEEVYEALYEEIEALSEELKDAIETGDAASVINLRNEIKSWRAKLKEFPSLTGSKQGRSLLTMATKEVSKAALWLEMNPAPDPRPLETEQETQPEIQPLPQETTTQTDLNPQKPSDQNPNLQTQDPPKTTETLTPSGVTPQSQEEKQAPTTASARRRKLI